MTQTSLDSAALADAAQLVREANLAFARRYVGEVAGRQPVHTVYGGAQLFNAETPRKVGELALKALKEYAPDAERLGTALGIAEHPALEKIHKRVVEKLTREAVEDYRIDFEDGYGNRGDATEDGHAIEIANALATARRGGSLPPFIGLRIKPLNEEMRGRSVRTLDLVLTRLIETADGSSGLPAGFSVTLPKITIVEQVEFAARVFSRLERALGFGERTLRFEIMVETPQIILGADGRCPLPRMLEAADGRLSAAHFGTYDYTAGVNITAAYQRMRHPACEHAKHVMQTSFAGTGVWLSDGSTTVLPVPLHRGDSLSKSQREENEASVHHAWKLHFDDVRHSLAGGFYQGWDLHPAQLVSRYAALYSFFLEGIEVAGARLANFVKKAAQATLVGDVFDDAATGQGLLNFFLRGVNSGAITEEEALAMTSLTADELRGRSFVKIMQARV
jgi:citrate lyase beta subunit